MKLVNITITIIMCFLVNILAAQNFVLDERSTDKYSNYLDQMRLIEKAIMLGYIDGGIDFFKGKELLEDELNNLSKEFSSCIPTNFFESKEGFKIIDTDKIVSDKNFIKWTYISRENDSKFCFHLQLIVHFQIGSDKNGIYFPKVESIELVKGNSIKTIDIVYIEELLNKREEIDKMRPAAPK